MTQEAQLEFFSLNARPWARELISAMLGLLLAVAPAAIVLWFAYRHPDAAIALFFGDSSDQASARLAWWLAAIIAHVALLSAVMLLTSRGTASRTILIVTCSLLALLLDAAVTAWLWITFVLAHPHGW